MTPIVNATRQVILSICYATSRSSNMNIVSAPQFLDNGIEFTLHEYSASFWNLGDRETFVLDYQDLMPIRKIKQVSYYPRRSI
jgi:hypothetical protein